ncbi:tryptophan synthase subunit alpha [Acidiferrimicrobium sp. IK]|uniref:tryptophan synthase subunit alpha n=1 Tax=Acidiferrimicrobium sp. IK TaxID=2871700 RepID=UPI0021CB7E63|nr:tryptophan synthase subunit alpha [Acidiferrimicrobium sp. IK]MCU4183612.1 tryptophan synthase subunit alpha [Acidiferrimicrobium sp. IK]
MSGPEASSPPDGRQGWQASEPLARGVAVEPALRAARSSGRKLLVPYVTGGLGARWVEVLQAVVDAGADAVEVGLPFSDPVMDGPTIQEASLRALEGGATPPSILDALAAVEVPVPVVAMTYYNLVLRAGHRRFAKMLVDGGVRGAIVPDLPLEELGDWSPAADAGGVETVLLAAPVTPDDRLAELCARSHGFVYGVNLMGVTGERTSLAASAQVLAKRLKSATDKPVVMGFGISTPEQAVAAASHADGVVVASALMRLVLDGASPAQVGDAVGAFRAALDRG